MSNYTLVKIRDEVKKNSQSEEHYDRVMNLLDKIKTIELSAYNQGVSEYYNYLGEDCYQDKINLSYKELITELIQLTNLRLG